MSNTNSNHKTSGKGRVLILDGRQRSTLAGVRSLGGHGIEVTVGEDHLPCLASRSKYATKDFKYASATTDPKAFIADITGELKDHQYDMILPMTDISMYLAVNEFDNISHLTRMPIAGKEAYLKAIDKAETIKLSRDLGIPVPKTFFINQVSDLPEIKGELNYPVVIKPG